MSAAIKVVQIHAAAQKVYNEKRFLQMNSEKIATKYVALLIKKEEI